MMIGMAAILAFAALIFIGGNWLQTTTYEVRSSRIPVSFDGYCIVQVSDLHRLRFGKHQCRLTRAIRNARPDLIAITGDLKYLG
jgi:predicted MPP superfamily phosphohydrolase